jgi:rhodanese-related sulfurtransferase
MVSKISAAELRHFWRVGGEIALYDVRDEGPYSLAHPFFAVSLPLAQIESRILRLAPRLSAPIVVYDGGEETIGETLAERAAARIEALGFTDVRILSGGLAEYRRHGEVFRDVNVASKAFGELVESIRHTPSLSAEEVKTILAEQDNVVVLDARRFEEYNTMSIPRGVSVPGAELALRVHDLAPSPDTFVIVNCAGRTRSIIGAQSLVNAGIPNKVAALRNGTIGWTLAGFELEKGQVRRFPATSPAAQAKARAAAASWAAKVGVRVIDAAAYQLDLAQAEARTLYRFDVRTPEEYAAGHPAEFDSAPGGQLVQATDEWVGVRGARLVLFDDDGVRALMTASWLVQMGWDAVVLQQDALEPSETGPRPNPQPARGDTGLSLEAAVRANGVFVDLATSPVYRRGHIPGAWFLAGARLREDIGALPGEEPIILTSPDGVLALDNLDEIRAATPRLVHALIGGTQAWSAAGLPLETAAHFWASEPNDVYKRPYEGTDNAQAAMQGYIDWELQLVAQLANDGVSNFRVVRG